MGELQAGREASFAIFDPEIEWTVRAEDLHSRHAISPYVGRRLRGRVLATYLRGQRVWDGAALCGSPTGRELRVC
jgi:allantoinase